MKKGTVKWFNDEKGFGFINPENSSEDIFVHYTGINKKDGERASLKEGQEVSYNLEEGRKGLQAVNVEVL